MDLDATVGGPMANSYVSLADATALLSRRLGTTLWFDEAATMLQRPQALMWATSLLEAGVRWYGQPTTTMQALAWPQTGQVDHLGRPIPPTVIPAEVHTATAVYALHLLQEQVVLSAGASAGLQLKSRTLGNTTITYQDISPAQAARLRSPQVTMPADVRLLLQPYGAMTGGLTVALLRT